MIQKRSFLTNFISQIALALFFIGSISNLEAQVYEKGRKFEQLGNYLATPNEFRTASGAPGPKYWQQQADYNINVELDDENQIIRGVEQITYTNNSPDPLNYLWIQLDQNVRMKNSMTYKTEQNKLKPKMTFKDYDKITGYADYDGGHKIEYVKDANGRDLPYTINYTMMRVDLSQPLLPGRKTKIKIKWHYNINDRTRMGGRGGCEYFKDDGNWIYTITQWFPRMAVYNDVEGWQNKQFLGRGEFALPFGNYDVKITVPGDHIVASTGVLQNPSEVLSTRQKQLFEQAKSAKSPVVIVSEDEAKAKEQTKSNLKKTWHYKASNVRDFAFGSSRKFIWDAMGVNIGGKTVMAMSYYPKEANPLYGQFSTEAVAHALRVYSKYTFDYPYPVAISVEAHNGMEYPMICFNYGRPEKDGTYSARIKYGMLSVVIHEVGHNFFPMIVNSDERQWTWMDEGLNSFVQYLAEQEWDVNYPHRRGPAFKIVDYMKGDKSKQKPIMTNSEQILQFGNNAYGKPATALNILRETVMGRELFDYAFKEYANRWKYKHPTPEDFFRTMEDASGVDLDWFWKGWFYSTDHVDIAISDVQYFTLDTKDPDRELASKEKEYKKKSRHISQKYNREEKMETAVEANPELRDFYDAYDQFAITDISRKRQKLYLDQLGDQEKELLKAGYNFYELTFENVGGLVMPIIVEFTYADGSKEIERLPAEIWRMNEDKATKVFVKEKEVVQIIVDPYRETADTDETNNYFPKVFLPNRFELYKSNRKKQSNPMQQQNTQRN